MRFEINLVAGLRSRLLAVGGCHRERLGLQRRRSLFTITSRVDSSNLRSRFLARRRLDDHAVLGLAFVRQVRITFADKVPMPEFVAYVFNLESNLTSNQSVIK